VDALHIEMLQAVLDVGESPLLAGDGPLWFRGFATWPDDEGGAHIASLLSQYQAVRFVVGHSVQREVTSRFDHRIFLIDTGMLAAVYKGRASALEIAGGRISAIYPDGRALLQEGAAQRAGAAAR
jgi:hypothetical protein